SKHLENILNNISSLSNLSSLVIILTDNIKNPNNFYRYIFRLPTLKYCTLSFGMFNTTELLPIATNEYGSIEHLIIKDSLSINYLYESRKKRKDICPIVLKYLKDLKHVSVKLKDINFDDIEILIKDLFRNVQLLYISTSRYKEYLDANRWERLILSSMPYLRIFDFQHIFSENSNENTEFPYKVQIKRFTSSFCSDTTNSIILF
ncbi:unnamed protein product, partial [Rotaria sp. Silwood1]